MAGLLTRWFRGTLTAASIAVAPGCHVLLPQPDSLTNAKLAYAEAFDSAAPLLDPEGMRDAKVALHEAEDAWHRATQEELHHVDLMGTLAMLKAKLALSHAATIQAEASAREASAQIEAFMRAGKPAGDATVAAQAPSMPQIPLPKVPQFPWAPQMPQVPPISGPGAPPQAPPTPLPPTAITTSDLETLKKGIHRAGPATFNIDRSVLDAVVETSQVVPEQKDGKLVGLRYTGVRPDTLPGMLGIEDGDVIESVNGVDLADPNTLLVSYKALLAAPRLVVILNRKGRRRTLTYNVKGTSKAAPNAYPDTLPGMPGAP